MDVGPDRRIGDPALQVKKKPAPHHRRKPKPGGSLASKSNTPPFEFYTAARTNGAASASSNNHASISRPIRNADGVAKSSDAQHVTGSRSTTFTRTSTNVQKLMPSVTHGGAPRNMTYAPPRDPLTAKVTQGVRGVGVKSISLLSTYPPRSGRSLLLELPREVRDDIYSLVYQGAFVEVSPFAFKEALASKVDIIRASSRSPESARTRLVSRKEFRGQTVELQFQPSSKWLSTVQAPTPIYLPLTSIPADAARQRKESKSRVKPKSHRAHEKAEASPKVRKAQGTSLMFTCKQICLEFGELVYSRTIFAFGSPGGLTRLLRNGRVIAPGLLQKLDHSKGLPVSLPISSTNRASIRHLHLNMKSYGEPSNVADAAWRMKYYSSCLSACRFAVSSLPSLEHLTLFVEIPNDRPYLLSSKAPWVTPLLQFTKLKRLKSLAITLISPAAREVTPETLKAFADVVHRRMIGWDKASALEAINEQRARNRNDSRGLSLDRQWGLLQRWNGMTAK